MRDGVVGIGWIYVASLLLLLGCGDSKDSLTCGEGTERVDDVCVVSDTGASSGGNGSDDGAVSTASGGAASTSGGGNTTSGDAVSLEEYPRALASALCDSLVGCCEQSFLVATDRDACVADYEARLYDRLLVGPLAVADPENYDFDADLAAACVQATAEAYAACDFTAASLALDFNDTCNSVFAGKLQLADDCAASIECANTSEGVGRCGRVLVDGAPICSVVSRAQLGASCNIECTQQGTGRYCNAVGTVITTQGHCYENDGLYCGPRSEVCEPLSNLGGPCVRDSHCAEGYCDTGECAALAGYGESCTQSQECESGLYCSSTSDRCLLGMGVGQSCTNGFECESGLCLDGLCVARRADGIAAGLAELCADHSTAE